MHKHETQATARHAARIATVLFAALLMAVLGAPATRARAFAQDAPAQDAPAQDAPAQEAPAQEAPAQEAPDEEVPAQEAPDEAEEKDGGSDDTDALQLAEEDHAVLEAQAQAPGVNYGVHRQTYGDQPNVSDGAVAGTVGESKRLEAFWATVDGASANGGIRYCVHVQGVGWQDWRSDGQRAGTSGQSKRLEAVRIELTGDLAKQYRVFYRVHAQRIGWMGWAADGETSGTEGMSWRLEAIQVVLVPRDGAAPDTVAGVSSATSRTCLSNPGIRYRTHVQTYGWQDWKKDGETAGTTGESKRLEALQVALDSPSVDGGVSYRVHVQTYGWQGWVADEAAAGTTGQSKRPESMCVNLTGEAATYFDVYYRVHAQSYGWMGWAKNGEMAGTAGRSKRLEACEIRIVPKGAAAPGSTVDAFRGATDKTMILVGDSRMLGTYQALYGTTRTDDVLVEEHDDMGTWWIMRNGAGYSWLELAAIERIDSHVTADSSVVIWLGVNDVIGWSLFNSRFLKYSDASHYASLINGKAREWTAKGASVYYATVGPVGWRTGDDVYRSDTNPVFATDNGAVRAWNADMASLLSPDVRTLDVYGAICGNYSTWDGLHYNPDTYRRCYDFIHASVV